jgi:hypothetical protein
VKVPALLLAASILLLGCGGDKKGAAKKAEVKPPSDPVVVDADQLGRALFDIVDRVMSYRSAHRSSLPSSLRQAGIDSLTPTMVLRYAKRGSTPWVTAAYRRPEGHRLESCEGGNDVLEDASLHDGAFTVTCTLVGGGTRSVTVGASQ